MTALARNAKHDVAIRGRTVPRQGMECRRTVGKADIVTKKLNKRSLEEGLNIEFVGAGSSPISTLWRTTNSQRRALQLRTSLTYR